MWYNNWELKNPTINGQFIIDLHGFGQTNRMYDIGIKDRNQ